ncbi:hypothetical protein BPIT_32920 [Candidatus Brocadia pituitae]|nr:hypothetical protein BPIT_32920 [Candidatus Brocadia pituitae]
MKKPSKVIVEIVIQIHADDSTTIERGDWYLESKDWNPAEGYPAEVCFSRPAMFRKKIQHAG